VETLIRGAVKPASSVNRIVVGHKQFQSSNSVHRGEMKEGRKSDKSEMHSCTLIATRFEERQQNPCHLLCPVVIKYLGRVVGFDACIAHSSCAPSFKWRSFVLILMEGRNCRRDFEYDSFPKHLRFPHRLIILEVCSRISLS